LQIDPDVRGAAIIDAKGSVMALSGELSGADFMRLAHAPSPSIAQVPPVGGTQTGPNALLFVEQVVRSKVPVDDIYSGIEMPGATETAMLGFVAVELSRREVSRQRQRLIAIGVLIALLGSLLGGMFAQRIARGVIRPLLEASEVVARIGDGDMAVRMRPETAGPLGSLARGINNMAARIGVTQEELRSRVAEATAGLQREKDAAEHATTAKSHFLAAASHDLRQPLHALGLFVSGLARSKVAKQEPELIGHIQSATDSLQNLLDALLDISRLDGGNIVPRIGSFALDPVFDRLRRDLSLLAEEKGLRFKVRPTSLRVHSDEQIVERILLNLVSNALRYTSSGGVLAGCRRGRGGMVLIEVWDTGAGVPESARAAIFEEYVQLGNPERDRAKGLGLGLAICRRLADLLEIRIGVRSSHGRGSVFWIELPLAPALAPGGQETRDVQATEPAEDLARIAGTVLVVDGDALVRGGMEQAIVEWGGSVISAVSREEVFYRIQQIGHPPDLLVCNIHLSGRADGIGLAQELRRTFAHMAVLLVSADVSEEAQAVARSAGFPLLKQPVSPGRLRAALRNLLAVPAG